MASNSERNEFRFVLNEPFSEEETRHCEFKEIKGSNPVDTIKNSADEYVVAFLNSEGGRIYWGIRDSDRIVVGVKLTSSQRDEIRRVVGEKLAQIQPSISPTAFRINFHKTFSHTNVDQPLSDVFVVEIVAPELFVPYLYFTGGNAAFVKTDGGKKKLSGSQLNDELLRRLDRKSATKPLDNTERLKTLPRLPSIYADEHQALTLHERFAELQKATTELRAAILDEHRRQSERVVELTRDPIPILLPVLHGTFVDRESEQDTLRHLLREEGMRLVVIIGPAGYGKTELTTKVLQEIATGTNIIDPTVQGILYVRCQQGDVSLGVIFSQAGRIAGRPDAFQSVYANHEIRLERKLEFFFGELSKTGNVWIVMDNFEDLLADDDSIKDPELQALMEMAASLDHSVRLIATTRAVPRFAGSRRLRPIDLREGLPQVKAIEYLRAEGAEYGLADCDEELLIGFAKRVHGIPKALESVIGYLSEKYPIVQLSDLVTNDALFADFDHFDTENGLKRLIAEQFSDQNPDSQLVLCGLSVFQKPATLAALRYLLPALDWSNVLPRLQRNRLISRQGDLYDLHPLVREHAYQQIPGRSHISPECDEASPEQPRTDVETSSIQISFREQQFNRESLHTLAADFFAQLRVPRDDLKTLADLEPQLEEFHHRVCAKEYEKAFALLNDIDADFLAFWGSFGGIVNLRTQLLDHLTNKRSEMENYSELGDAYFYVGDVQRAKDCYERALPIAVNIGDRKTEGILLGDLGDIYESLYETEKGIETYEAALLIAREINDQEQEADHLSNLGLVYIWMGKAQKGIEYINQALEIARATNDRECEATQLGYLGIAYQDFRDIPRAIQLYEKALAMSRAIGDRTGEATHLCNLGSAYREIGSFKESIECHQTAWGISKRIQFLIGEGRDPECLGLVYHALGDVEKAIAYYQTALKIDKGVERWGEGMDLCHLGRAYYDLGKMEEALKYHEEALGIAIEVSVAEDQYEALLGIGMIQHSLGNLPEASRNFKEALKLDIPKSHYSCSPRLGIVRLEEGFTKEADDHLARGIRECEALLEKTPKLYDALYHLALAELAKEQPDRALATYRRAIETCAAKGVLMNSLRDVRLLTRLPAPLLGLRDAESLLAEALKSSENRLNELFTTLRPL